MNKALSVLILSLVSSFVFAGQVLVSARQVVDPADIENRANAIVFDATSGVILAVGKKSKLSASYPHAQQKTYPGKTILPGFIDAHAHLVGLGFSRLRADLRDTRSIEEILDRLKAQAKTLPEDAWLLGRGWDQNDWPGKQFPTRRDLDNAFPERPVWLRRIDGHAGWANSAALNRVKENLSGEWQPQGGRIFRDENGKAEGVLVDKAMDMVEAVIPPPDEALVRKAVGIAVEESNRLGLTGIHEAGMPLGVYRILEAMASEGKLSLRIYAMADGDGEALATLCRDGFFRHSSGMLQMRSVKFYIDGALGSRGAALLAPYSDEPSHSGLLLQDEEGFSSMVKQAMGCGVQVNVHAIGDRGNRVVLDALAAGGPASRHARHRVEHAQVVSLEDIPRFAELGVIASMQPTHATSDMPWAEDRVGPDRIKGAYAWRRFLEAGAKLAFGSDFPVEETNPLLGLYAAVKRTDAKGEPAGGWYADQNMTRKEALLGFTEWAAYAAFDEHRLGSLKPGYQADFVVWDKNLATIEDEEILTAKVKATWVAGKAVYEQ